MRRSQSEFLPSAWSAQAEIPHPHGNAQSDSLSYPGGRRETGTIDLRPRSLSGPEPEGARDRMSAWASRLRGKISGEQTDGAPFELRRIELNLGAEFGAQLQREIFNRAPKIIHGD